MRGPDPTHWEPLWAHTDDDGETYYLDAAAGVTEPVKAIPAERVTVAPEPYTPQVGDRVRTDTGDEATLLAADILRGTLPCVWHDAMQPDQYGTIDLSQIVGLA